jgi:hypothetical protein
MRERRRMGRGKERGRERVPYHVLPHVSLVVDIFLFLVFVFIITIPLTVLVFLLTLLTILVLFLLFLFITEGSLRVGGAGVRQFRR